MCVNTKMVWKHQCIEYFLTNDDTGIRDNVLPTAAEMTKIISTDVKGTIQVVGPKNAEIVRVFGNKIMFRVKEEVIKQYGDDVFQSVDDDGNYPVVRQGITYLFSARRVKTCSSPRSSAPKSPAKATKATEGAKATRATRATIVNPLTGRRVLKTGRVGRALLNK